MATEDMMLCRTQESYVRHNCRLGCVSDHASGIWLVQSCFLFWFVMLLCLWMMPTRLLAVKCNCGIYSCLYTNSRNSQQTIAFWQPVIHFTELSHSVYRTSSLSGRQSRLCQCTLIHPHWVQADHSTVITDVITRVWHLLDHHQNSNNWTQSAQHQSINQLNCLKHMQEQKQLCLQRCSCIPSLSYIYSMQHQHYIQIYAATRQILAGATLLLQLLTLVQGGRTRITSLVP